MIPYSEPGYKYKDVDIDGELIDQLTLNDLVNEKGSRDGIPSSLFPLRPGLRTARDRLCDYSGRQPVRVAPGRPRATHAMDGQGAHRPRCAR